MKKSRNHPSKASVSIYELQAKLRLALQNFTNRPAIFSPLRSARAFKFMTKAQLDYEREKANEGKSMSFDTSPEPDAPWKRELKKLSDVLLGERPASQIIKPNE